MFIRAVSAFHSNTIVLRFFHCSPEGGPRGRLSSGTGHHWSALSHCHHCFRSASSGGSTAECHVSTFFGAIVGVTVKVGCDFAREAAVVEAYVLVRAAVPLAVQMLQALGAVFKTLIQTGVILTEHIHGGLPLVRLELVEAFVVKHSGHLGDSFLGIGAGDDGGPFFLLAGLEFVGEMFPFDREVFIRPRHIDFAAAEVCAVFAYHGHMQREPASHSFVYCLFNGELREAALGPEALEDFAAMLDLDERARLAVAAAPQRHELVARLNAPRGRLEHVWYADFQLGCLRVEYLDGRACGDFFAKAILCFENHAVGAFL